MPCALPYSLASEFLFAGEGRIARQCFKLDISVCVIDDLGMKLHDGEIISDDWSFDNVGEMDGDTLRRLPWMSDIDTSLCETATIAKTEDGRYLLIWKHNHPESTNFFEYFEEEMENETREESREREAERLAEFRKVVSVLPGQEFSKDITRKQAWETIAYFWLPEEWHRDAGIA
jgi:hypothetical protein